MSAVNNEKVSVNKVTDERRLGSSTYDNGELPSSINEDLETTSAPAPSPAPDGGLLAWWQCFAAFCIYCNTWGLLNAYGVFQSYYQQHLLSTSSASQISWIGTVQSFFILFGALWAGPLFDWGYLRALVTTGSIMLVVGTFLTGSCTQYYQVLLSQGFLVGLGLGCIFAPMPGVVSQYFDRKRSLALGIAAVGSSVGGIIYPIIFTQLIDKIGFGWTVRVLGFIILALQIPVVFGFKMRVKPSSVRRIFDVSAWTDLAFVFWAASYFFAFIGLYVPYFYIQIQAVQNGSVTTALNFYLLPLLNVGGLFGRLVIGYLGDYTGPVNIFIAFLAACCVLLFSWIGVSAGGTAAGVVVFCLVYGFFSGAVVSMTPTCVAISLCADIRQFGVRWSMISVPWAVGLLVGDPLAGAVLGDSNKGSGSGGGSDEKYLALQLMSGVAVLIALVAAVVTRVLKVGWSLRAKI